MDGGERDKGQLVRLYLGVAILLFVGLGSIFAASITITKPNSKSEFGEGVYKIKACDSYIRMNLISGATGELGAPPGLSPLKGISISSLNSQACKKTTFTVNAYDSTSIQVPLYRTDALVSLCSDSPCTSGVNSENDLVINIDANANVLLNKTDSFHSIEFDPKTGIYRVLFTQPALLANEIGNLTIQSSALSN